MRRGNEGRTLKYIKNNSPLVGDTVSMFKKVQCQRGHSLMRRTEYSWEKLHNKQICSPKEDKIQSNKGNTDYFTGRTSVKLKSEPFRQKFKATIHQNSKSKSNQRGKLFLREKIKKTPECDVKFVGKLAKDNEETHIKVQPSYNNTVQIQNCQLRKHKKDNITLKNNQPQGATAEPYQIDQYKLKRNKSIKSLIQKKKKIQQSLTSNLSPEETYQLDSRKAPPNKQQQVTVVNKTKEEFSTMSSLHNSALPLFSKKCSSISNHQSIPNKIHLHLQILGELAQYSKQLLEQYEDSAEWEQLAFLVYKKYYMERLRVARALRGIGSNPFNLTVCGVLDEELQAFRKKLEGIKLAKEVQTKNKSVVDSLRGFYNLIIEKSGNHINLEERNDFTREIFKDMQTQISLLREIKGAQAEKRLARVYRCGYLIAEVEGNLVMSYEQSLNADDFGSYLLKATNLFHKCLIL